MDLYKKVMKLFAEGGSGVLVTLVQVEGSTPRKPGTKMLVIEGTIAGGTIGGGGLEQEMIRLCEQVLTSGEARMITYAEDEKGGLACGGKVSVFLEPLVANSRLFVVGYGHVGRALVGLAENCDWQVTVLDDRKQVNEINGRFLLLDNYNDPFADLNVGKKDFLIITGRSHEVDLQALRAALATQAGFIGLLGSSKKKAAFFKVLTGEGVDEQQLARVVTPVGLNIGARTPAEIAVSIMAQLIEYQNGV